MQRFDTKDIQVLQTVQQHGGATLSDLGELLQVTRTAVRQRVARLETEGLLRSEEKRQDRGRPKLVYQLTEAGRDALGDDYRDIAIALWTAVAEIEDEAVKRDLMARVRSHLSQQFQGVAGSLGSMVDRLNERGFNVELDETPELPILRESTCPFPKLAELDQGICEVERELFEQMAGVPVEVRSRCHDGGQCCEFELQIET